MTALGSSLPTPKSISVQLGVKHSRSLSAQSKKQRFSFDFVKSTKTHKRFVSFRVHMRIIFLDLRVGDDAST